MLGDAMSDILDAHSIQSRLIEGTKTAEGYRDRRHIDLIVLTGIAFAALFIGNQIDDLGLYASGDDRLSLWSALHFLSHDDPAHAGTNLQDAAVCSLGLLCLRSFRLTKDAAFLSASVLAAWAATMIAFIWLIPPSPVGAHGYSVFTHAMFGFMATAGAASIAMAFLGRRAFAALAAIIAGGAVLVPFVAFGFEQSSQTAFNGFIGHLIGLCAGTLGGIVWSLRAA